MRQSSYFLDYFTGNKIRCHEFLSSEIFRDLRNFQFSMRCFCLSNFSLKIIRGMVRAALKCCSCSIWCNFIFISINFSWFLGQNGVFKLLKSQITITMKVTVFSGFFFLLWMLILILFSIYILESYCGLYSLIGRHSIWKCVEHFAENFVCQCNSQSLIPHTQK